MIRVFKKPINKRKKTENTYLKTRKITWAAFISLVFEKSFSKFFCICLLLEKLVNEKYFSVNEKFKLVSRKVFSFYFEPKILFRSCEKFRNVILFADYIKFGPQTFDCYIYINIFFQFHPLKFNFYINFVPYL
jgi:hypothetical protein